MPTNLLTIGEFAKLSETTRRTVLWYGEKGILLPSQINPTNGYRLYTTDQVIDFKAILLLRKLNFSLPEIKSYLAKHNSPQDLFTLKKKTLQQEIAGLQTALIDTDRYYQNLRITGTLVNPKVKVIPSFPVYYMAKLGPYHRISEYFSELRSCFEHIPEGTLGLVIYEDIGYQPKNAKTKICFQIAPGLKLKSLAKDRVKTMTVPGFKALSYTHSGSSQILSLLWQELKKYRQKSNYQVNNDLPFEDIEISLGDHVTEMLMPVL